MKRQILSFMTILMMVFTALTFVSCGDSNEEDSSNILKGTTWVGNATEDVVKGDLTFRPLGTLKFVDDTNCTLEFGNGINNANTLSRKGTYTISADNKTVTIIVKADPEFTTTATISNDEMTYDSRTSYGTFKLKKQNY